MTTRSCPSAKAEGDQLRPVESLEKKRKVHRYPLTRRQLNDWAGADFRFFFWAGVLGP